jgi:hypothetical protein
MIELDKEQFKKNIHLCDSEYGEFSLKKFPEKSGYKVNIQLLNDHELIAYLAFKIGGNFTRADFSGMFVKEKFRRKGVSKKMFQLYQDISKENGLSISRTKNQKKPLVCKILQQFGYSPVGKPADQMVEIVGDKLFFADESIKNKYLNSSNHENQNELSAYLASEKEKILGVVDSGSKNGIIVFLNTNYKK